MVMFRRKERVRYRKLEEENNRNACKDKVWRKMTRATRNVDEKWMNIKKIIQEAVEEVYKKQRNEIKARKRGDVGWNKEVQAKMKEKKHSKNGRGLITAMQNNLCTLSNS